MKNKTRCSFLCSRSSFRTVTAFLFQMLKIAFGSKKVTKIFGSL
nr:MAG TPA: hypothetical protein [Caudoviricetes sp.]